MNYPVFLINLDRQPDRYEFMNKQLVSLGMNPIRITAVNGRDTAQIKDARVAWYAQLTPGEIGCFESHRKIWQQISLDKIEGAFVLEDDVVISSEFPQINFGKLQKLGFDLVKLDQNVNRKSQYGTKRVPCGPNHDAIRLIGTEFCTSGYFVTLQGAEKLLANSDRYFVPVDRFMFDQMSKSFWNLVIWKLESAAIIQIRIMFPSNNSEDDSISKNRISGNETVKPMTFIKQTALRLRRLLDYDIRTIREKRKINKLQRFLEREAIEEKMVLFTSSSLSHVPNSLGF